MQTNTELSLRELLQLKPFVCACGKTHAARLKEAVICDGAIGRTAETLKKYGGTKPYILADENTWTAAGERLAADLTAHGVPFVRFLYPAKRAEPDEAMIGAAVLHFDKSCDCLIALGSGVLNDVTKILSNLTGLPFVCVATAPSMDGFASSTSSVIRDGLKVSVDSRCPDAVIGDLDVLAAAPPDMLRAGMGDMLAKYVSVCEWRIGRLVTGEYYCESVAGLIRQALKACTDNAAGLMKRDKNAVRAVMEGLILSGVAADWAGVSRPVSGVEHYFSHVWDMRALEFGTPFDLHGIQCGIGTLYALRGYELLLQRRFDAEKARRFYEGFDRAAHESALRAFLGKAAEAMLRAEETDGRGDPAAHAARVEAIRAHGDEIRAVIREELPPGEEVLRLLETIGAPTSPAQIGLPESEIPAVFRATRDVRDKYILSALCFDTGELDEIAAALPFAAKTDRFCTD